MSYTNLIMYNAVIPSYNKPDDEEKEGADKTTSKGKIKANSFGEFMSQMKQLKGYER